MCGSGDNDTPAMAQRALLCGWRAAGEVEDQGTVPGIGTGLRRTLKEPFVGLHSN